MALRTASHLPPVVLPPVAPARLWALPHRWLQNLIHLREKRPMRFGAILMVVVFVALARGELELLTSRTPGLDASSVINNVAFYLQSAYLYGLVASWLTGRGLDKVMGVVAIGVFMGIFPPLLDALLLGVGQGYYRYVTGGLDAFRFSLVDPRHYTTGEAIVLWTVVGLLGIYVAETTRSLLRTLLAVVASYAAVVFIAVVPSSLVALLYERGTPFPQAFAMPFLTFLQLATAQVCYLACKPKLRRKLAKRLIHGAPFVALVALGLAVSEWLTPSGLGAADRMQYGIFGALCIFQLCVAALVQNDAFDASDDRGRDPTVPTREDAYFFTATAILQVLSLVLVAGAVGAPLALFLVVAVVYSFPFYRGKNYFPTNYKCEGIWGWSSFVLGGSASHVLGHERLLSREFLLASLLVFGGFSVFNVFKDYKDIRADYHARVQTLYVLLARRRVRLSPWHRRLSWLFMGALLVPPGLLLVAGLPHLPVVMAASITVPLMGGVLAGPPRRRTVMRFIAATTAYLLSLALVVEAYGV